MICFGMNELNHDEFDTVFELILCVMFMSIGIFAMANMVKILSNKVEVNSPTDKIEITRNTHYAEDPFYFTGFQAYMFSWHMDEYSYVPITWLGGDMVGTETTARTDGTDNNHVTISVLDDNGKINSHFLSLRNQYITGVGKGTQRSVKKSLTSIVGTSGDQVKVQQLYQGKYMIGSSPIYLHLECTDAYTNGADLGTDLNTGGKTYKWVLVPKPKP